MLRAILGGLLGVIVAGLVTAGLELAGHAIWPPPAGMDPSDPESIAAHMSEVPAGAKAAVALAWGVATLLGGLVAGRISKRPWLAYVVAGLMAAGALFNLTFIPSPVWMWALGLGAILAGGFAAARLSAAKRA